MLKFAKITNEKTKSCQVGLGTNEKFYRAIGMTELEVEQAYDGSWYLKGYSPVKPETTVQEQVQALEAKTGFTRTVRELVLAENSGASNYAKQQAQEIETLAAPLREAEQ